MKFVKKPIVIEAVQWDGNNLHEVMTFGGQNLVFAGNYNQILIYTKEGTMQASVGDWIIKGIKGEFYPCKPDIFEATYEAVNDE